MGQSKTFYLLIFGIPTLLMAGFSGVLVLMTTASIMTASPHGVPREGILPLTEDLGTWDVYESHFGTAETHGDEMHLSISADVWDSPPFDDPDKAYSWQTGAWTYRSNYGDFSASVDIRSESSDPLASGCLMVRADPEGGPQVTEDPDTWDAVAEGGGYSFNLCLSEDYGLFGWWWDETASDYAYSSDFVTLWGDDIDEAIRPIDQWNRLKVVAKGDTIWMFVNGRYAGVTRYPGPHYGSIGIRIDVERDGYATFAFRDLEIRRLGWI